MQKINIIMSDVSSSNFARDIPVVLRHMCGVEATRILHTVPQEHMHHKESMREMFKEAARASVEQADLVIIPGGEDINPAIYGQPKSEYTDDISPLCFRDEIEEIMISGAAELDKPIIYICRGYQLAMGLLLRDTRTDLLQFCQHLPLVTNGVHRADFFKEGRELIFHTQYILEDFVDDLKLGRKSPLIMKNDLVHKVRIYPGTITHWLYKDALGYPKEFDEPLDIDETSHHHQGIQINPERQMPENYVCSAMSLANDEVPILEGFERTDKALNIGFQWHLEANATGRVGKIFHDIVAFAAFKKANNSSIFWEWAATQ
jgi:gamma-glutamyl-gamma-aminobutyrate hydrolase PuuD